MTRLAHLNTAAANLGADKDSVDFCWPDLLTSIFPNNTAAYVASFTRTTVRAAEHVLSGRGGMGGRAIINLLRSPHGPDIIDAIAGGAEWRTAERTRIELAELVRGQEKQRRLLDALIGDQKQNRSGSV